MAQREMKCAAPTLEKQDDSPGISVSPVRLAVASAFAIRGRCDGEAIRGGPKASAH